MIQTPSTASTYQANILASLQNVGLVEAQMRFPAPSEATPNAFNRGNVVERLIGTRVGKNIFDSDRYEGRS